MFTYVSLFSGVGGFDVGFDRAGGICLAQVEFNPQASGVLAHHWPNVKRYKDVKDVGKHNLTTPDVLCGGFPCQDVSVAGKRKGLAGERTGLWFEFHRIITELAPEFVIIENVPGLLSSHAGQDFAVVLGGLTGVIPEVPEIGWGNAGFAKGYPHLYRVAWRVLDAKYFGVAQRRRRVFIVASLGNGRAAEILFESEGGSGNTEPGFTTRQSPAPTIGQSAEFYRRQSHGEYQVGDQSTTLQAHLAKEASDLVAFNVTFNDANGRRKDRPDGGLYVNETDKANTLSTSTPLECLIAGTLSASGAGTSRTGNSRSEADMLVVQAFDVRNMTTIDELSSTLQAKSNGGQSLNYINPVMVGVHAGNGEDISPSLMGEGHDSGEDGNGRHAFAVSTDRIADFVETEDRIRAVQGDAKASTAQEHVYYKPNAVVNSLDTAHTAKVITDIVRRLTPTECERLQNFPDGWTAVNGQADSTRYKQMGNAVCTSVSEWIGNRIMQSKWKEMSGL